MKVTRWKEQRLLTPTTSKITQTTSLAYPQTTLPLLKMADGYKVMNTDEIIRLRKKLPPDGVITKELKTKYQELFERKRRGATHK